MLIKTFCKGILLIYRQLIYRVIPDPALKQRFPQPFSPFSGQDEQHFKPLPLHSHKTYRLPSQFNAYIKRDKYISQIHMPPADTPSHQSAACHSYLRIRFHIHPPQLDQLRQHLVNGKHPELIQSFLRCIRDRPVRVLRHHIGNILKHFQRE